MQLTSISVMKGPKITDRSGHTQPYTETGVPGRRFVKLAISRDVDPFAALLPPLDFSGHSHISL